MRDVALAHGVCPYYLGQELARWSDVVVGDYNYFFDGSAMLHGLALAHDWRVGVLVDEAHNLVERARAMYSASIDGAAARALQARRAAAVEARARPRDAPVERAAARAARRASTACSMHRRSRCWRRCSRPPPRSASTSPSSPRSADPPLQAFYSTRCTSLRLAESFGAHSLFDLTRSPRGSALLCLRNVVPAPLLKPRFAAARSVTLFSATLQPAALPPRHARAARRHGVDRRRLAVRGRAAAGAHRRPHLDALAAPRGVARSADRRAASRRSTRERPGNYLAFFSSFDYLESAAARFAQRHADVPAWRQSRGMSEAEQAAFLERFAAGGRGIGFAVLGGSFAEGIDLPGDRLVGAFIATLGLPQSTR